MIPAHPLLWPENVARTPNRARGAFKTGLPKALANVESSLRLFGTDTGDSITGVVITSNYTLWTQSPPDPGIAVWFTWQRAQRAIAVDKYTTIEANLQAVHLVLESRRTEFRHAGIEMVRATFQGFIKALPAPSATPHWTQVLGLLPDATPDEISRAWRDKQRNTRSDAERTALNIARDAALAKNTEGT